MKLGLSSALLALVGFVAIADAAPTPYRHRMILVDGPDSDIANFRLGHPAVHASIPHEPHEGFTIVTGRFSNRKAGCHMRMKATEWSNWFRQKVGFPQIEPVPTLYRDMRPDIMHVGHHNRPNVVPIRVGRVGHHEHYPHPPFFHPMHEMRPTSFPGRLHKALATLGPWEGRAVAFVLGCGIGSLLRMVWVLVVLSLRSHRREPVVEQVVIFEEIVEDELEQPLDEKVAPVQK